MKPTYPEALFARSVWVSCAGAGLALLLAGCAQRGGLEQGAIGRSSSSTPPFTTSEFPYLAFSAHASPSFHPGHWNETRLGPTKTPTHYSLRRDPDSGRMILFARSARAASAMTHPVRIKLEKNHRITWRWKVSSLIDSADNTSRQHEDSPVRIVLAFAGDKGKLGFRDHLFFEQVKLVTGHEVPYATLMYIWENKQAVGAVLNNPHTGRVRMIVAESGPKRVGQWLEYTRNLRDDFRQAFGEDPGELEAVGVLTDTDNTGAVTEAYYGDIRLFAGQ